MASTLRYADIVLDFYDSGAGQLPGPYGGTFPGSYPVPVDTSVVLGDDGAIVDFLSLPTGSYVTVGFHDEAIVNKKGPDILVEEVAGNGELADVYVSSDGVHFTKIGQAEGGEIAQFDLSDISWNGVVTAVKIVGLNLAGASWGYDVAGVSALHMIKLADNNTIKGTQHSDVLHGRGGNDKIFGRGEDDSLFGDAGKDILKGGSGDDKLFGGNGNDKLTGGKGSDWFVFRAKEGKDVVTDFSSGEDMLDFSAFNFNSKKAAFKKISEGGNANDDKAVFAFKNTKVIIKGADESDIHHADLLI